MQNWKRIRIYISNITYIRVPKACRVYSFTVKENVTVEARSAKWKSRLADFRESLTHTRLRWPRQKGSREKGRLQWQMSFLGTFSKIARPLAKSRENYVDLKDTVGETWLLWHLTTCRLTRSLKTRFAAFITDVLVCLVFLVTFTTLYKESKKKFSIDFVSLETLLFYSSLLKKDPSSFCLSGGFSI